MDSTETDPKCNKCSKTQSQLPHPLKRCSSCRTTCYCSVACQKTDWPSHKKSCGITFDEGGWQLQTMPARIVPSNEHLDLEHPPGTTYHNILKVFPEHTTYKLLIESFRIWDEDVRVAKGKLDLDKNNPRPQYITGHSFELLKWFMWEAEQKEGVLSDWWNAGKKAECQTVAREMYHWSDIETTVPKEIDDWRRYGGPAMRIPLRLLATEITGIPAPGLTMLLRNPEE